MRITLLGTGSADGWPNPFCGCPSCEAERDGGRSRAPSSALVDDCLLIDCGPTTPHLPAGTDVSLQRIEHAVDDHVDRAQIRQRIDETLGQKDKEILQV